MLIVIDSQVMITVVPKYFDIILLHRFIMYIMESRTLHDGFFNSALCIFAYILENWFKIVLKETVQINWLLQRFGFILSYQKDIFWSIDVITFAMNDYFYLSDIWYLNNRMLVLFYCWLNRIKILQDFEINPTFEKIFEGSLKKNVITEEHIPFET